MGKDRCEKLYNFGFLKIIFIIAIIVHHFYHVVHGKWNSGYLAVEFFFIISGFLFAYTYNSAKTCTDFIINKLIRFIPLLCFTSIITAICSKFDLQKLLADIFLLQRTGLYQLNDGNGYNTPAWYISVLFWILLFYFYTRKCFNKQISNLIFGIVTFISISAYSANNIPVCISRHFLRGLGAVGIGYFACIITQHIPCEFKNKINLICSILELTILCYFSFIIFSSYKITNKVALMLLMAFLLILFYIKNGFLSQYLNKKIFDSLSKYVLPVYLTHIILFEVVLEKHLMITYPNIANYPILTSIVGIIASFVFGILAHHLVEKPSTIFLNNSYNSVKTLVDVERERERLM